MSPGCEGAALEQTAHRPWPPPSQSWLTAQTWRALLFAHWPARVDTLRPLIPERLEIDTYEGEAWVGVVPFYMTDVHFRYLPPLPFTSAFAELNVRTYVRLADRPGVWFFSLDAASALAVAAAQRLYHLPYFRAKMAVRVEGDRVHYASRRVHGGAPPAEFAGTYHPTSPVYQSERGTLEHWLTERYCLYAADGRGRLYRGEVHHAPWPLQKAEAEVRANTMTQPHGIALPDVPPLLHYADCLKVVVWSLEAVA